jgi:hypothetical protein
VGFVLRLSAAARGLFTQVLAQAGVSFGSAPTFVTQVAKEGALPGLVAKDGSSIAAAVIEAKLDAPRTPEQPTGYLNRLHA